MTKVEIRYSLAPAPGAEVLEAIGRAHGIYGVQAMKLSPALDTLTVQYDASRLRAADVDAALRRAGIPATRMA